MQLLRMAGDDVRQLFHLVGRQKHNLLPVIVARRHFDEPKAFSSH